MKKIILGLLLLIGVQTSAQISVFDCNAYIYKLKQSEIDIDSIFYGPCIEMGGDNTISISGNDRKTIKATHQILLKDGIYLGGFDGQGQTHLLMAEQSANLDVVVMNYPDLYNVLRYKKLEFGVPLETEIQDRIMMFINKIGNDSLWLNPFVDWNIDVMATFYNPQTGWYEEIDGFYTREYVQDPQTHDWNDRGTDYPFRIRYAPPENGDWIAQVHIRINGNPAYLSNHFRFSVVESGDPGYVHIHENRRNLKRGNKMIFPVGQNFPSPSTPCLPWSGTCFFNIDETHKGELITHINQGDTTYTVDTIFYGHNLFAPDNTEKTANTVAWNTYLEMLEQYLKMPDGGGLKYFRTIQTPYSSLIEFEEKGNYYHRLHYASETDKILDLSEQYDALFQFNFMIQEPMMKYANYDMSLWDWDYYKQDGSLPNNSWDYEYPVYCYNDDPSRLNPDGSKYHGSKQPHEMFLNESDLAYHKQRIRYYIARYGYSTKIYSFEILSEPWHLNESWASGQSNQSTTTPFLNPQHPEHNIVRNAVNNYHKVISEYIKDSLNHWQHLIAMDMASGLTVDEGGIDVSVLLPSIDIIGFNLYYSSPNALISSNTNSISHYIEKINLMREIMGIPKVPIIIPEGGTGENLIACSGFTQDVVDKMTLPFTGIAGFNTWPGYLPNNQASENDPLTMPTSSYEMWKNTIRSKNHINGNDVINTLSNGWGNWKHGKEKTHIKFPDGLFQNDKPELLEQQHYVSSDKSKFTGYVRNRTYNARTRGCSNLTFSFPNPDHTPYFYLPYSIPWDSQPLLNRLKVNNLQQGEDYRIHWYSFKTGNYIKTDCLKATNGNLRLEFPMLTASYSGTYDNPVVWFVAERSDCNQNKSLIYEDSIPIRKDIYSLNQVNSIYPNPFDDYFIVNSLEDDVFILQSTEGTKIGKYNVLKGANKIDVDLPTGVYIGKLLNQSINFKIIKR